MLVFEHANVKVSHNELNVSAYVELNVGAYVELNVCNDLMSLVNEVVYVH